MIGPAREHSVVHPAGRPAVRFILKAEAGKRFGAFTGSNIGNFLAVVLDNKVRGIHFYTLNRSTATREIYASLGVKDSRRLEEF